MLLLLIASFLNNITIPLGSVVDLKDLELYNKSIYLTNPNNILDINNATILKNLLENSSIKKEEFMLAIVAAFPSGAS